MKKTLLNQVELPDPIKLLIVDDETEIIDVIQDYFEVRKEPAFNVRTALRYPSSMALPILVELTKFLLAQANYLELQPHSQQ